MQPRAAFFFVFLYEILPLKKKYKVIDGIYLSLLVYNIKQRRDNMSAKVINIYEIKYKNMLNFKWSSDIIYIDRKKRNIRQEMIKGYMELLSNQINK